MLRRLLLRFVAFLSVAYSLVGCTGGVRAERYADRHDLRHEIVRGDPYLHLVLRNDRPLLGGVLHIYLEGDGTPYLAPTTPAADPTPRQPLMLHLLAKDRDGAIYVGRPCYFGLRDPSCQMSDWTTGRFSRGVVSSLAVVIRAEQHRASADSVWLIGHSGGAALAVLLTRELAVSALITIGGNLDTERWTSLHGYSPLQGSLNPVEVALPPELTRHTVHYVGTKDVTTPALMVREAARHIGGEVIEMPGFTHQCCWESRWPEILASTSSAGARHE